MAHGQPDYGMYSAKNTVGSIADNAELAARLGSIVTFDRRGDVLWWDDFEDNEDKWIDAYVGGAGTWGLSPVAALQGGNSGRLTTAVALGATAQVSRGLFFPVASKLGYEIAFIFGAAGVPLELWIDLDDGTDITTFLISYNYTTRILSLVDVGGVTRNIATALTLIPGVTAFHYIKLVIDVVTEEFVRLLLDNNSYDISAYRGQVTGAGTAPRVTLAIRTTDSLGFGNILYLENCIFTQNEP